VFSVRPSPEVESGLHLEGLLALAVERLSRERQRGITLKEEPWRPFVNKKQLSASVAGDVSLGGKFLCMVSASEPCALPAKASGDRQKIAKGR